MKCRSVFFRVLLSSMIVVAVLAGQKISSSAPFNASPLIPSPAQSENANAWRTIDSLAGNGLTESALKAVETVYQKERNRGSATEQIKALLYIMRLESYKEEQSGMKAISRLERDIDGSKGTLKAVLHSVVASMYWRYYQQNRWKLLDRTKTIDFKQDDLSTWDLSRIVATTLLHYEASLDNKEMLRKTPLASFGEILIDTGMCGNRRPTLYDFLAHRAVDFYMDTETDLPQPAFVFQIDNAHYLRPYDGFVSLGLATIDSFSLKFRGLTILQDLIRFHKNDADPGALVDADLKRLSFVRDHATLDAKDSLYCATLEWLEKKTAANSVSAEVSHAIAKAYAEKGDLYKPGKADRYKWYNKKAIDKCSITIEKYPRSYGAGLCAALKSGLCAKELALDIEEVNLPDKPVLARLAWKNVTRVWLRAVPVNVDEYKKLLEQYGYNQQGELISRLKEKKPAAAWNITIPDDGDFQRHVMEIAVPQFKAGHYVVCAGTDSGFNSEKNGIAIVAFWVSRIAYFGRSAKDQSYELYVRDRGTGAAIANAVVKKLERVYDQSQRTYSYAEKARFRTDAQGLIVLPPPVLPDIFHSRPFCLELIDGSDTLLCEREVYQYPAPTGQSSQLQTFYFTDRSIYRPGQTIHFKAIVLNRKGDKTSIVPNHKTIVELFDVNSQRISGVTLVTNDYGTVNGTFIAPLGVLSGQMRIGDKWGSVFFSVEEYKRPKFEVTTNPVKGSFRLNETVTVTGRALAYAGSAIDGASVKYRVVRMTQFPYRFCWWSIQCPVSADMEISNGTTTTDDTGGFCLSFKAIPDPEVAKSFNPVFTYSISIDVTDGSGETRSCETAVSVGYTALALSVDVPEQVEKGKDTVYALRAANLNGVPQPTRGLIRIFRLKGPNKPLRKRLWEKPDVQNMSEKAFSASFPAFPYNDEDLIVNWPKEKKILEKPFDTKADSLLRLKELAAMPQGVYMLEASAHDVYGQEVRDVRYFTLYSLKERTMPAPLTDWFSVIKGRGEPGSAALFAIGSAEKDVRVLFEVEHKGTIVTKEWLTLSGGKRVVEVPIEERFRGNFCVHATFVKGCRIYFHDATVTVPWTNKELGITFETFRNKLLPGQKEEWKVKIAGKNKDKVAAEMVASLYDESLDAFSPHSWHFDINSYYSPLLQWDASRQFGTQQSTQFGQDWNEFVSGPQLLYPSLNWFGFEGGERVARFVKGGARVVRSYDAMSAPSSAPAALERLLEGIGGLKEMKKAEIGDAQDVMAGSARLASRSKQDKAQQKPAAAINLASIKARSNLNETAFFYPHLKTNESGEIIVSFTVPEALTKWKMLGFAHTKDLRYGLVTNELVTQKNLMVMPNLPRFVRENDAMALSASISNMSDTALTGSARLLIFDAATMKPADSLLCNTKPTQSFSVGKGKSASLGWEIKIPEGIPALTVRVVATAGVYSDGEENTLPVLVNRMLVTETMPLSMRTSGKKKFSMEKLILQNGNSSTLRNHKLTLEFTQNPAWYAVQAIPFIMEYPYECAEQTFARYYANTMAASIVNSAPRIKAVFDLWKLKSPEALLSNLEKNPSLKSAILEETPWVLDGVSESGNKKRIGMLFDLNRMSSEMDIAKQKLKKMQLSNGGWPWFEGMPDDRFITQYIVTGMGRLRHLSMIRFESDRSIKTMVEQGLSYCDNRIREDYERVLRYSHPDSNNLGCQQVQYLYARSFFKDIPIAENTKTAAGYFAKQAEKYWLKNGRYLQAMIALALDRMGKKELPLHIIRSLKENSLVNEEIGMYWKESYEGFYWYEAPIESQALYIEAFDEVAHDSASVEAMKVWLLKSKQTQNWKTTKATAEACYALLLRGSDWLPAGNDVTIDLGTTRVDPKKLKDANVEAGTGYFQTSWSGQEIIPAMGNVTVTKTGPGVAWGALYWQYFEQLDKITSHETPLKLNKKLFVKRATDRGPVLDPITEKTILKRGDKVVVRIELRVDRDVEYVHMKDLRAAGFEPRSVLSGCRWQGGLGYYESTRDASANFFFSRIGKGTFVFEYELVTTHKGNFSNGVASIQCMYAPEFASHSEGIRVKVGE